MTKYELHMPLCTIVFGVPAKDHEGKPIDQTVKMGGREMKIVAHDSVTLEPHKPAWIPAAFVGELKSKGLIAPYVPELHPEPPPEPEDNGPAILQTHETVVAINQPDPNLAKGKNKPVLIDPLA